MPQIIRYIDSESSLSDYRSAMFAGNIFVSGATGAVYKSDASGELGGIGDVFKKISQLALPLVGTIAAPFTGGMSLALTSALNAGGAIGAGLLGGIGGGGGGGGGQFKGLAGIQTGGQQVIDTFGTLKQKVATGEIPKSDAYTAADKLVSALSDSSTFYQAKKGADAAALAGFKTQAATLAAEIKSLADAVEAQKIQAAQTAQAAQTGGSLQTGSQTSGGGGSDLPFGLSWVEIALGVGAIYFFTRR